MSTVRITMNFTYGGEACSNVFHYWNNAVFASNTILNELAADFETNMVAAFQAATVNGVVYDSLRVTALDNPTIVNYGLGAVTGSIVAADAEEIPVDIVANIRRNVDASQDPVTGAPYGGSRPVRAGRFYVSGLAKEVMNKSGLNTAATSYGAVVSLLAEQANPLTTSGAVAWQPIVLGLPLAALPPSPSYPSGKPSRDYLAAVIDSCQFVEFTKLSTRDD